MTTKQVLPTKPKGGVPAGDGVEVVLNLPEAIQGQIAASAFENGRSIAAEILAVLVKALKSTEKPTPAALALKPRWQIRIANLEKRIAALEATYEGGRGKTTVTRSKPVGMTMAAVAVPIASQVALPETAAQLPIELPPSVASVEQETSSRRRLSNADKRAITKALEAGQSPAKVASKYKVSMGAVYALAR